jgi:hypothetical protein
MSSPFDAIMAADLAFIESDVFSEPITITRATGQQIPTAAVIDRQILQVISGSDGRDAFTPQFEFWIPSTVLTTPPDKGGDTFTFPTRVGDSPTNHVMVGIVKQDAGGWLVRCK